MIYVITHKKIECDYLDEKHYKILHVGPSTDMDVAYLSDSDGDNISIKNANYCELTGLYWIWKNGLEKSDEATGLVHYRRFFSKKNYKRNEKIQVLDYQEIQEQLKENKIILPKKVWSYRTVGRVYSDAHYDADMDLIRGIIQMTYPEYLYSFDKVMRQHWSYYFNMMICQKNLLDEYANWLFSILFKMEEKNDINKYANDYQKRVYGFISERLLQVWVQHNNLKVKEYPVVNVEQEENRISRKLKRINARMFCRSEGK